MYMNTSQASFSLKKQVNWMHNELFHLFQLDPPEMLKWIHKIHTSYLEYPKPKAKNDLLFSLLKKL